MMPPTLVLSNRYTGDAQLLWSVANRRGWNVERVSSPRLSDTLRQAAHPVLYLEGYLAHVIAEELGVTLVNPPEDFLVALPYELRQREISLTTMGEAKRLTVPMFVKTPNDKDFPAQVYAPGELTTTLADWEDELVVLLAEPVEWEREFRCFVLDGEVQTLSAYLRGEELDTASTETELATARTFAERVLACCPSLPAFVLDVGVIKNRGWAVVEANAAWGAGIYNCDPELVIDVVQRASLK
jgi:ATP-grasp domain, R2K clade family 2